ncbi:MAG: hypothetical protein WDO70_00310 [Alphaproteobacteria bacterium]
MTNSFNAYVMRQGEPAITAIIENWERLVGLRAEAETPLEQRWAAMMHGYEPQAMAVA